MDIGIYIKSKRLSLGLSQRKLAKKAGLNNATISRIENEGAIPDTDTIIKLAKALETNPTDLINCLNYDFSWDKYSIAKFARVLKSFREKRGLTQQQLSSALGISENTIRMYEDREREPDIDSLKKLSDYFGRDFFDIPRQGNQAHNTTGFIDENGKYDPLPIVGKTYLSDSARRLYDKYQELSCSDDPRDKRDKLLIDALLGLDEQENGDKK